MRDRLIELLKSPHKAEQLRQTGVDIGKYEDDCVEAMIADFLLANGVIVLPCKVGSTLYRIDEMSKQCSYENEHYDEFYCRNCRIRLNGDCDARKEPYIFVIQNANAQAILGNQHLIGTRVFLTREEAEKALAEREGK